MSGHAIIVGGGGGGGDGFFLPSTPVVIPTDVGDADTAIWDFSNLSAGANCIGTGGGLEGADLAAVSAGGIPAASNGFVSMSAGDSFSWTDPAMLTFLNNPTWLIHFRLHGILSYMDTTAATQLCHFAGGTGAGYRGLYLVMGSGSGTPIQTGGYIMKGTTKIPLSVGGPWKAGGHDYNVTVWCDGTNIYSGTTPNVDIMPTRYEDLVVSRTLFRASANSDWTVDSGSLLLTSNNAVGPLGVSKVILSKKTLGVPAELLTL